MSADDVIMGQEAAILSTIEDAVRRAVFEKILSDHGQGLSRASRPLFGATLGLGCRFRSGFSSP